MDESSGVADLSVVRSAVVVVNASTISGVKNCWVDLIWLWVKCESRVAGGAKP